MIKPVVSLSFVRGLLAALLISLALLALCLAFASAVHAQDVEATDVAPVATPIVIPDDPTDTTPVVVIQQPNNLTTLTPILLTVIILGLLATFAVVHRPAVEYAAKNAPVWAIDAGYRAVDSILDSAKRYAEGTPEPYDDAAIAALEDELDKAYTEIRRLKGLPVDVEELTKPTG